MRMRGTRSGDEGQHQYHRAPNHVVPAKLLGQASADTLLMGLSMRLLEIVRQGWVIGERGRTGSCWASWPRLACQAPAR